MPFASHHPGTIRVASYNIRKAICADRRRRPDRILAILAEVDADIVALQEADRRFGARQSALPPELIASHSDYVPVAFDIRHGSLGWHGNAVLVRKGIEVLAAAPLTIPTLEPRGAVRADLRLGDARVRIIGMHLDLSGLMRRRQVRSVLDQAGACDPMPTVLMGDLNEWSVARRCIADLAAGHHVLPTPPSFHARQPVARLDRIVVSRDIAVDEVGVHRSALAQIASDHLPVWARLRLPTA
jgi:endonuclease/exonuclease/phosphatase family metal-dependent hydrolase